MESLIFEKFVITLNIDSHEQIIFTKYKTNSYFVMVQNTKLFDGMIYLLFISKLFCFNKKGKLKTSDEIHLNALSIVCYPLSNSCTFEMEEIIKY